MKKTALLFSCILLAGAIAGTPAMAQFKNAKQIPEGMSAPSGDHEEMGKKMDAELGLTPEQREKMKALREAAKPVQEALHNDMKAKRTALKELLDSDKPDRSRADALAAEINTLQGKLMANHIDQQFKIREILTPEQYKKLDAMHKERKSEWRGKHRGEGKKKGHDEHPGAGK